MALGLLGVILLSPSAAKARNLDLQVGVVQRFGEEPTDQITLEATPGDLLTVRFLSGQMQEQTLQTDSLKLETTQKRLLSPIVEERLVLSNHGTFETAEDSANQWRNRGIEVEITQPERWQVWAKRDVYRTPLLRRLLLQSLQAQGNNSAYLETQILPKVLQASFVVNHYRYNRQELEISAGKNLIRVSKGEKDRRPRLYPGSLRFQPNSYGTYTLVNRVPLESYLRGVVPHEIGGGAPYAAVEAQTIIARTYALRNRRRFSADGYELCADTHCQVYKGLTNTWLSADRAIASTKGLVLTYNNELVDALYSSTTGGITAPFSDIWNGSERPYLRAVVDAPSLVWDLSKKSLAPERNFREFINLEEGFNESQRSIFRWRKQSSLEQIAQDLKRYLKRTKKPNADFTEIKGMRVVERSPAGRVLKLVVETDKSVIEIKKNEVRSAFGPPRSTLFYLEPIYGADQTLKGYAFVGGGFGHGVGLSQYGSHNLAKLGWTGKQILSFYYPGTQIRTLNDSIVFWKAPTDLQMP
ncbi:MAG: SpoIID/LytB domain-containing protein [Symploca sp. SIO3C6]|uniref:SpoIID/LytB domain-containing protein n=1 Tax=Symploca sp. SIO1C4 TaxID=2607765 RepID=A0A6B3MXD7_9CYAN|nr:SpoIID/LytB domain-containing protein [Symploca sp. SIO3C6]NER26096.1 SpoIID/LytB domain-containing protein [Symploca sp. SIO1C4]